MKMIVILYNDIDVIIPYATNEPLSLCYATNGWCFLLDHTLPNYVKNNIANLFWTNKKLHFHIQS